MPSTTTVIFSDLPLGVAARSFFGPPPDALSISEMPVWSEGETIGGELYSWQEMSTSIIRVTFRLQLNDGERESIWDLYHNRLKGPTKPFSYTHTNGKKYTGCRWVGKYTETREPNAWLVDVTLRIVDQAFDAPTVATMKLL